MSRLTDLLRAAKQLDPQLGEDLEAEIHPLQKRLPFGLNFERHAPEAVELAGHKVRKGSKVRILPPRGSAARGDQRIWRVESIAGKSAVVALLGGSEGGSISVAVDDLILVAEFRDRIYPGLHFDGAVERGGDKPFHTVINGENFHVLEQLTFTHEQSVDAIYIDPPYNTGARDWKYNNDYVEGDDLYRHSKWLAFMERRLKLAKRLLNPKDSVLIVTIDEKEYLRLGLLLEQTFPEATVQMVSVAISSAGVSRSAFTRTDEFYFYVTFGDASPHPIPLGEHWNVSGVKRQVSVRWESLLRSGNNGRREDRPNLFYPVLIDRISGRLKGFGQSIPVNMRTGEYNAPDGTIAVFPYSRRGAEACWRISSERASKLADIGAFRVGKFNGQDTTFSYLKQGELDKAKNGTYSLNGYDENGTMIIDSSDYRPTYVPPTQWNVRSHNAGSYGSSLLKEILPGRSFPFPKSLYAVEDSLRFFVSSKPEAVILDFFAGSGTTAHAVMRLNNQDGGRRQCISVTNNEVSADEQTKLRKQGLRAGDTEWEKLGICDYVTKPRLRAAITGNTSEGDAIKGDYKFVDEFPMSDGFEENASFFTLTYESPWRVSTDRAFAAIAPMLWLRAGAMGRRIDSVAGGWDVADSYGIINDLDKASEFVAALESKDGIRIAYIVTDDEGRYQQVANEIPKVQTVRLYEDYLRNCEMTGDF